MSVNMYKRKKTDPVAIEEEGDIETKDDRNFTRIKRGKAALSL